MVLVFAVFRLEKKLFIDMIYKLFLYKILLNPKKIKLFVFNLNKLGLVNNEIIR